MSHVLHLIVTEASSYEEAMDIANQTIQSEYVDDVFPISCGGISETNEFEDNPSGRFSLSSLNIKTISDVNKMVAEWLTPDMQSREIFDSIVDKEDIKNLTHYALGEFGKCIELIREMKWNNINNPSEFNVLKNCMFEYQFDRKGVTHCQGNPYDGSEGFVKKWVIFMDIPV
jgi:hypothetical protein